MYKDDDYWKISWISRIAWRVQDCPISASSCLAHLQHRHERARIYRALLILLSMLDSFMDFWWNGIEFRIILQSNITKMITQTVRIKIFIQNAFMDQQISWYYLPTLKWMSVPILFSRSWRKSYSDNRTITIWK